MTDDEEQFVRMLIDSLEGMVGLVQLIMPSLTDEGQRDAVEANHRLVTARTVLATANLKWPPAAELVK